MDCPYFYDYRNRYNTFQVPSTVHLKDNVLASYFARYLLQKAISVFKWKVPEQWALNYMLYSIYCRGYVAVINTDKFGVIPQHCNLSGYDVFYAPTHAHIANPHIKSEKDPRIGVECTLIRLQPDYGSIMDIVWNYAGQLANAYETASLNMFNSKLSYVFVTDGKNKAETFKKMMDEIYSGNPSVYIDKKAGGINPDEPSWTPFTQNVGSNYIYSNIISDMRKIEAMYDTEIGIPNANTDKRERLITDEVNANNIETISKCELWLESLKKGVKETNEMFGTKISVDWRFPREELTNGTVSKPVNYDNKRST